MAPVDKPGLHRLIYVSSAVGVLPAHALDRILLRARVSNGATGITGFLLFHNGTFLQCLEGPPAGVLSLMDRIRRDRRHSNVVVLESVAISERTFGASAMGYVAARNLTAPQREAFVDLLAAAHGQAALRAGLDRSVVDHLWSFLPGFLQSAPTFA